MLPTRESRGGTGGNDNIVLPQDGNVVTMIFNVMVLTELKSDQSKVAVLKSAFNNKTKLPTVLTQ